jgi:uncharacterized RDD family membrane protein YckC
MDNFYENTPTGQDVLSEFEVNLVQANTGKRFANYLIDIVAYLVIVWIVAIVYYAIVGLPDDYGNDNNPLGTLWDRIIFAIIYAIIMGLTEGIFKGKSLGKLITGTRAVNMDGTRITFKTAFLRGFSRVVPFEAFSAFGSPSYPWHDKWTDTYVVDEKQSTLPS